MSYAKITNILILEEINIANSEDLVYISFTSADGSTGILSLNFSTGNIISVYDLNNNLSSLSLRVYNSALYGYYAECCTTFYRFYYDFSTNPNMICFDSKPTGTH